MADMCGDNRFELIEKYKRELIECTNIETSPNEMAVLDTILFRFWQMGWLDKIDKYVKVIRCKDCRYFTETDMMLSTSDGAQERMTICKLTHTGRFGSDYCSRAVPKETE